MFYNTIHSTGSDLKQSIKQAEKQDLIIYNYFLKNPYVGKTCWELSDILGILITSCRRSVTNLVDEGKLIYNGMRNERQGKKNHIVFLKIEITQTKLFND